MIFFGNSDKNIYFYFKKLINYSINYKGPTTDTNLLR